MIKLFGLLLLFFSSVMVGLSIVFRLRERVKLLRAFSSLVHAFRLKLSVSRPELLQLFLSDIDSLTQPITSKIAACLAENGAPQICVPKAFDSSYARRLLKDGEREYLSTVFSQLGSGDIPSALEILDSASTVIESYIKIADDEERSNSKTTLTLSVYIGLAAVILLM